MLRRDFLRLAGAGALAGLSPLPAAAGVQGRVVVVGGGYAGAAAAKYLRLWGGNRLDIVLVEPRAAFVSCPLSNLVLGGSLTLEDLTFGYGGLERRGIRRVQASVEAIDAERRQLRLSDGDRLGYDRLILAPGIDFVWPQLPMLEDPAAQEAIPHAWKAGPQTLALRRQLEAMPDGGVFVIGVPLMPYRCPPGPYERACQAAWYFKRHKPRSKVIVLDANPEIVSKKALFTRVWAEHYPGMVDYRPNSAVAEVDVAGRTALTEFERVQADVLNIIPPQSAGRLARDAGLANVNGRWCEVDFRSYASKIVPGIHIVGDAVSAALPKSAHMASSQAKVCASAVLAGLAGAEPDAAPVFSNTCYSFVSDRLAMHVAHVYRYDADKGVMLAAAGGGVSEQASEQEGNYARSWAQNIWSDVLT